MILVYEVIKLYLRQGKKLKTFSLFLKILCLLKIQLKGLNCSLSQFLQNIAIYSFPLLNLVQWAVGSRKYRLPVPITWKKSAHLTAKWIMLSLKDRTERTIELKLLGELADIFKKKGNTLKLRREHHLLAFENKAFMRFLKKRTKRSVISRNVRDKIKNFLKRVAEVKRNYRLSPILRHNEKVYVKTKLKKTYGSVGNEKHKQYKPRLKKKKWKKNGTRFVFKKI